ncbi:hypothetical protein EGH21_21080 [Halomicroarcula sp. F13]|uniref:Uncharacterized protein n=1 Tax=Haloarcula rubra TaxID=2487747 RepID=A0AAW4PZA0_9EURY|nr:hypothetical protein [Halomicroarcula rubra]MBX0325522.1 hypothetical protein [Halomicroarcula rubra]
MSTKTGDRHERFPTTGPVVGDYTRYTHVTSDEDTIIYDENEEDAWVQATKSVNLDTWR